MTWRLWPVHAYVDDQPIVVGYELSLHGVHDHPSHPPEPGCDACALVYRALHEVALAVVPDRPATEAALSSFEPKLVFDHANHGAPAVELRIDIIHRSDYTAPLDECEVRCKDEIVTALEALGVHHQQG